MTNKPPIPWTRIAAESAAIIFSILIAFSLEAWWSDKQRQADVRDTIDNLIVEFTQTRIEFDRVIENNKQIVATSNTILAELATESSSDKVDLRVLAELLSTPTSNPQRGVLDAMISSGRLDLVRNDNLRMNLAAWPAQLANWHEEEIVAQAFVHDQLRPFLTDDPELSKTFAYHIAFVTGFLRSVPAELVDEMLTKPDGGQREHLVAVSNSNGLIGMIRARKSLSQWIVLYSSVINSQLDEIRIALAELERQR